MPMCVYYCSWEKNSYQYEIIICLNNINSNVSASVYQRMEPGTFLFYEDLRSLKAFKAGNDKVSCTAVWLKK